MSKKRNKATQQSTKYSCQNRDLTPERNFTLFKKKKFIEVSNKKTERGKIVFNEV